MTTFRLRAYGLSAVFSLRGLDVGQSGIFRLSLGRPLELVSDRMEVGPNAISEYLIAVSTIHGVHQDTTTG